MEVSTYDIAAACEGLPWITKKNQALPKEEQIEILRKAYCGNVTVEILEKKCEALKNNPAKEEKFKLFQRLLEAVQKQPLNAYISPQKKQELKSDVEVKKINLIRQYGNLSTEELLLKLAFEEDGKQFFQLLPVEELLEILHQEEKSSPFKIFFTQEYVLALKYFAGEGPTSNEKIAETYQKLVKECCKNLETPVPDLMSVRDPQDILDKFKAKYQTRLTMQRSAKIPASDEALNISKRMVDTLEKLFKEPNWSNTAYRKAVLTGLQYPQIKKPDTSPMPFTLVSKEELEIYAKNLSIKTGLSEQASRNVLEVVAPYMNMSLPKKEQEKPKEQPRPRETPQPREMPKPREIPRPQESPRSKEPPRPREAPRPQRRQNVPDLSFVTEFLYRDVDKLVAEFDENEQRFRRELSQNRISINNLQTGLYKMDKTLKAWKGKQTIINSYDTSAIMEHFRDFERLMERQAQMYREAERRYAVAQKETNERKLDRDNMERKVASAYSEFAKHVVTIEGEYRNYMDTFQQMPGKLRFGALEEVVMKLEQLHSESLQFVHEFSNVTEKYMVTEDFAEITDKCRSAHNNISDWYYDAKDLYDAASRMKQKSKGRKIKFLIFLGIVLFLCRPFIAEILNSPKEYKAAITAAQNGDSTKFLEYLEDHQRLSYKQFRADTLGNLRNKVVSNSITSLTVGDSTGFWLNQSTPVEMTIDNGMMGAKVKADLVLSVKGIQFENIESDIQWIDVIGEWITDGEFDIRKKAYKVTWTSYDPETGGLEGTYLVDTNLVDGESPATGTLDTENGTLTFRYSELIEASGAMYTPKTYVCHIDPLYGTFVDEDGYTWCLTVEASEDE